MDFIHRVGYYDSSLLCLVRGNGLLYRVLSEQYVEHSFSRYQGIVRDKWYRHYFALLASTFQLMGCIIYIGTEWHVNFAHLPTDVRCVVCLSRLVQSTYRPAMNLNLSIAFLSSLAFLSFLGWPYLATYMPSSYINSALAIVLSV